MTLLMAKKVSVSADYVDFVDIFLEKSVPVLSEQTGIN